MGDRDRDRDRVMVMVRVRVRVSNKFQFVLRELDDTHKNTSNTNDEGGTKKWWLLSPFI